MTLTPDTGLIWDPVVGGAPCAVPSLPSDGSADALVMEGQFWVVGTAAMERGVPPYGDGDNSMVIPVVAGELALPGVIGTTPQDGFRKIANVLLDDGNSAGFTTQGRKFDGMDLVDYQVHAVIPCDEASSSYSTAMPDVLARAMGTHSWDDSSRQLTGTTAAGVCVSGKRQHGRVWKATLKPRGLTIVQADAAIRWYRAVRGDSFAMPAYVFGPSFAGETVAAVCQSLKLTHIGAHLWDAELALFLGSSTSTRPAIWSISPAYVPSGSAANVVVFGSGFDDATTVTVGGMAATVVSWTSGRLNITAPAGVAGQYEVVVANASGSSTGVLWRYDAGAITIGTGGIIMGTTSEAVAINQPVGWIGDDVAVADPIKGIPAGGYANAAAAQGAALQVNQTGHATPISGLTPGLVVYLGAGGTYTHTPPSKAAGAIFSQQLGYATETGVAFSAMQPVYL